MSSGAYLDRHRAGVSLRSVGLSVEDTARWGICTSAVFLWLVWNSVPRLLHSVFLCPFIFAVIHFNQ